MARRGVYWRLRDPATPWSDRIKLVRYAWRHQAVHIPNKHQVLLDWLTLSLTGKKRVPANEAEGPWRCLCDVLWSRICQTGTGMRAGLVIKNVVGQVLLDELRGHLPGGRGKSGAGADTLLSCVEAVLTSRSLQHVYTNRIDTMMQLLAVTCELCVQDVETGGSPSSQKVALLNLLLTTLGQTQWRRVNVQQALTAACSNLLLSAARFTHTLPQLTAQSTQLCDFICQAVFHIDLWEHYQLYIGAKATSSSPAPGSTLPKDVEVMFKVTETLLQAEGNRKYILSFLPVLYEGFLNAYKVRGTQSGMHLFIYLTALLGIDLPTQGQTEVKGQTEIKGQEVTTLALLLDVAVQHEVYDVSYGGSAEERQLPWLQQLAGCLLGSTDKSVSWYDCLHHLVAMDHTIVEMRLAEVFTAIWVNVKELSVEQQLAQGRLLAELVTLYGRLRRFPVMIDRCLSALRDRSVATPLHWPEQFTNSLISVIAALPANSCVSLWRTLLTELTSHYLTEGQKAPLAGEAGAARLLGTLLGHAHLADYNVPHQVAALVRELLQMTSQDVINVMLHRTLKESHPDLDSVLSLTAACGDLRLLLVQFTPLTLGGSTGGSPCWTDMTLLYPGVAAADWAAICKRADERKDAKGLHLIDGLAVQKLRAVLLQDEADSASRRDVVQNVATHLLDRLTQTEIHTPAVWNKQVGGIDRTNWQVALLDLVCRHVTLLVPVWSDAQTLQFVQLVLDVVLQPDTQTRPQNHLTILSVASEVLGGATWNELVALQSAVVTVLLDRLGQLCQPAISPKKKRRSSVGPGSGSPLAAGLLSALSDTSTRWQHISADDGEVADTLQTVSDGVMVLLTSDAERFTITGTQDALKLLQILDRLPLEHFTPLNKARCILGQLVLTSTKQSELVSAGLGQLSVVLDSADVTVSMRRLDPGSLLLWLLTTADEDIKSLSLREDVVFNVLKQATKDMTSTQLLKPFLAQCHVVVMRAGQGDATSTHQMSLVAKTLGTLRTVVERAHQEAALRGVCVTYFTELAASTLSLLTQTMAHRDKATASTAVCNSALQCYRHALDHQCHVMRRRQQIRQQRKAARKAEKMEVDKAKEDKEEEASDQEPEPSKSSDEASATDDSDESEAEEGSETLGAALRSQLPSVCDTLQQTLSSTQDADSLNSCLPLVTTICTNYAHLKRHLPDNFCHDVLSLVLNTLHTDDNRRETRITDIIPDNPYCQEVWSVLGKGRSTEEAMETGEESAENERDEGVSDSVRQTAVAIMASLSSEQFSATLHQLLSHLSVECLQQSPSKVAASLRTLQELLDAKLEDDTSQILKYACHNVLVPIQDVLSACGGTALTNATCDVISTALSTLTKMLAFGPSLLSSRSVSVCLHSCQYVPLDAVTDMSSFNTFHQRAYEVLNAMLIHHEKTVFGFIPAFIQASKRLMTSVIVQSDQSRPGLTAADTEILVTCALRIYRLYSLIATHKVNFTKVAPYMVADYIDSVQRVTVLPKVKKSLVSAVHKVMDLCDEHAVRMLSTVLPPSGREIFRTLHTEFTRYHRYRGRV